MVDTFPEKFDGFPEKVDSCRCQISNFHMMHCAGYKTIKKSHGRRWVTLAVAVERMGLLCYLIISFLMVGDVERRTK